MEVSSRALLSSLFVDEDVKVEGRGGGVTDSSPSPPSSRASGTSPGWPGVSSPSSSLLSSPSMSSAVRWSPPGPSGLILLGRRVAPGVAMHLKAVSSVLNSDSDPYGVCAGVDLVGELSELLPPLGPGSLMLLAWSDAPAQYGDFSRWPFSPHLLQTKSSYFLLHSRDQCPG